MSGPVRRLRALVVVALGTALFAVPLGDAHSAPAPQFTYFEMSDGVKIAVSISFPEGYEEGDRYPVLFHMDGYGGGGATIDPARWGDRYITVYASIRGTGCSGGRFDLFDRRHARDGYEIIEHHLATAPWSTGEIGIIGHSYPGLTGWMVASTDPPSVEAVAISGLIDDLYRGIVYPGGVPNYGFPAVWTGVYRPAFELAGNASRYVNETAGGDATCAANIATRPPDQTATGAFDNPVLQGATSTEDDTWWQVRSTVNYVHGITKPIHLTQQYQDEQTGPRGGHVLFERISESVPKRLVLTNGVHSTTAVAQQDRLAWLDCWIIDDGDPAAPSCQKVQDPNTRVNLLFETASSAPVPAGDFDYSAADWPLPETEWTRYYLRADGTLSTTAGGPEEPAGSYVSTSSGRQVTGDAGLGFGDEGLGRLTFTDGPDQLRYELEVPEGGQPLTIAGPINLTLRASSSAPNTDFFVDVLDVAPDGKVSYLQRGMQRASHRAIDATQSDFTPGGDLYRAYHPHTNTTFALLTPGVPETFEIEVFPVGHVFRPGHKLVIAVHAPPPADPLSIYAWVSGQPPAVNTVLHGGASSILLPVLPATPRIDADAPACGSLLGVPCFTPVAG